MGQWQNKLGSCCIACAALTGTPLLHAQTSIAGAIARQAARPATSGTPAESANASTPPATLEDALHEMFRSADTIFTGEVMEIRRDESAVLVRWRVEDAVRGAAPGAVYDLREWTGLWEGNGARYTVGQRALVMLHALSVKGYASPVAGGDGIVPLRGDAPNSVLDLRLLAQHVAVTDAARLRPVEALRSAGGSLTLGDALQARAASLPPRATPLQRAPEDGGTAVQSAPGNAAETPSAESNSAVDGAVVLGMLHAWQREAGFSK